MHRVIGGRIYRDVSLDSDPLHEDDEDFTSLDKLIRFRPTPQDVARTFVRTRNGNLVQQAAR